MFGFTVTSGANRKDISHLIIAETGPSDKDSLLNIVSGHNRKETLLPNKCNVQP